MKSQSPFITLLTDFGLKDHYAGVMKGVIANINPAARVVDIGHEVDPFQIPQAAYLLSQSWHWFPKGTVHVCVVDPGVGSARRPIAAELEGHRFVLPDNGLLRLAGLEGASMREIRNPKVMLSEISQTFHGRDIFAPTAAHLTAGFKFDELGPLVTDPVFLGEAGNCVLHVDHFGNVVTSLRASEHHEVAVKLGGAVVSRHVGNYAEARRDELVLIEGSGGFLEISMQQRSAAHRLKCRAGDRVEICSSDRN